ncbi:MAG: phospholipid/cholesterol/gamma-HCH transport system substrate-binding protein [Thermoleophilaceae bacterium]|jgi:phospholipid/cholesterol/gamma-HCH transport system substrate-binding protein|nr:phospholipid/cholesterol/gamma-HCH transport system substrate-binding protein [Thermoleophilaceae bacterium]
MRLAIRKHLREVMAVIGLILLALVVAVYILSAQSLRFPFVEEAPKHIAVELENAQAVQPGQGQSVRVAGVEVGRISGVKVDEGVAVVDVELEHRYENLIRDDATALLRPKTALKDMFLEVTPGTGRVLKEGGRIPVANTLPDVDPDEIYAALDADTRPYLKLLVSGAGKGLRGRGADLREVFRRFEPVHRDLARVTRATARRRAALKRLIHRYGVLLAELGRHPDDLRRLVSASHAVFDTLAGEDQNISTSVARLPGSLRASERALSEVRRFAPLLRTTLASLREPIRRLPATNAALTPFLEDTTPVLRDEIRPFVRTAGPFTDDLRLAARDVSKATPDLGTALEETNRFFNIGAYNPGGAEALAGLSVPQQRSRSEGFLYWLGWAAQNGVSLFSSADAQGPWRRVTICKVPALVLNGLINEVVAEVGASNPGLIQQLIGGTGSVVQPGSPIDQLLGTGFGSCDFAALPTP